MGYEAFDNAVLPTGHPPILALTGTIRPGLTGIRAWLPPKPKLRAVEASPPLPSIHAGAPMESHMQSTHLLSNATKDSVRSVFRSFSDMACAQPVSVTARLPNQRLIAPGTRAKTSDCDWNTMRVSRFLTASTSTPFRSVFSQTRVSIRSGARPLQGETDAVRVLPKVLLIRTVPIGPTHTHQLPHSQEYKAGLVTARIGRAVGEALGRVGGFRTRHRLAERQPLL